MLTWRHLIVLLAMTLLAQAAVRSFVLPLFAQPSGRTPAYATVLATCGTGPSYSAGNYGALTVNTAGQLCVNQ